MDPAMIETPKAGTLDGQVALEPSWHKAADQDSEEENEILSHIIKSEYEVQDNWYADWNDEKEEHDDERESGDSDVEDDDSKDGESVWGSYYEEYVGDGDSKEEDFVGKNDFDVDSKSRFEPYIMRDCRFCGIVFDSIYEWRTHMDVFHNFSTRDGSYYNYLNDNEAMCKTCNIVIRNHVSALKMHVVKHLPHTKIFKCRTCSYANTTMEKVRTHIENKHFDLVHAKLTEKKIFRKCVYCSDCVGSLSKLSHHIRKEHPHVFKHKMQLVCPVCGESFDGLSLWKKHLQQKHQFDTLEAISFEYINRSASEDAQERTYRCLKCRRTFGNTHYRYHLLNHAFKHLPYKPYKCKFCKYDSLRKDDLIAHTCETLLTEIESKPYLKDKPSSIEYLTLKNKIKIIDKIYVCPSCEQHFESVTLWSEHLTQVHNFDKIENLNIKEIHEANSRQNHKCLICDQVFPRPQFKILILHAFSHMPHIWTKCKFCLTPIKYTRKCTCKWKYKNVKCQCYVCGYLGNSDDDVDAHFSKEHKFNSAKNPNFSWICIICDFKYNSKEKILEHISRKHKLKKLLHEDDSRIKFLCPVSSDCPAYFNSRPEWRSHISIYHALNTDEELGMKKTGNVWKCLECCKVITESSSKLTHKLNHFTELPFQCRICDGTYRSLYYTRTHALKCTGKHKSVFHKKIREEKKSNNVKTTEQAESNILAYPLQADDNTLQTSMVIDKSVLLNEFEEYVSFACPECNKKFDTKTDWHAHINKNHDFFFDNNLNISPIPGRRFSAMCKECGGTIHGGSRLIAQRHKLTHMPYSSFLCRLCNVMHSKTLKVIIHHIKRVHLKHGTYPCYFCDMVCQTYVERYDHIKSQHNGVKWPENVCEVCMKSLKCVYSKEQHMKTHDFDRATFPCGYCQQKFLHSCNRRKHWKRHHHVEYEAKLAEQQIARKVGSKKKCNQKKPSSTRVKSTYSPIKNPKSTKKVKITTNYSKVTNEIKKFDVQPDFEVKREPESQHPAEFEFEPVARNAETKKNCKRKKSSNITRARGEFHSYEDSDESTYSPIKKQCLKGKPTTRTARAVEKKYELRSESARAVAKNFYQLKSEPDCNAKSEPESEYCPK